MKQEQRRGVAFTIQNGTLFKRLERGRFHVVVVLVFVQYPGGALPHLVVFVVGKFDDFFVVKHVLYIYFLEKKKKKKSTRKTNKKGTNKNDSEKVSVYHLQRKQWSKKNIPSGTWSGQLPQSDHCVACACGETEGGKQEVVSPMPVRNRHTIVNSTPTIVSQK
jgi:uncharacterized membrane protein YkvA (DUF1232 family)